MGKVLFIADKSFWSKEAATLCRYFFEDIEILHWECNDPYPSQIDCWTGDWILSFKSDLILSESILLNAKKGKINIHPAPPRYRGVEGYQLALKNLDRFFGATCHHMIKSVDKGDIIETLHFPITDTETYESLRYRTAIYALILLNNVIEHIINEKSFPVSDEKWGKKLYRYSDFLTFNY
jgi:methionyl-tRNA formyltransferase